MPNILQGVELISLSSIFMILISSIRIQIFICWLTGRHNEQLIVHASRLDSEQGLDEIALQH